MAKTVTAQLTLTFGDEAMTRSFTGASTGDDWVKQTDSASTSATALAVGDVGTEGDLFIKNTGDTNNLILSLDGGSTWPISIEPGKSNLVSVGTAGAPWVKTLASTTTLEYFLTEE